METWGSWTFGEENENLLAKTLGKFAADQCNLDVQKTSFLSTFTTLPEVSKRIEIADISSDDDDDDDGSDIDGDFRSILHISPKLCAIDVVENVGQGTVSGQDVGSNEDILAERDTFNDWSFQTQLPEANGGDGNTSKLIVELLSPGDFELDKLCSLLKTELKNQPNVSEIIDNVLPKIITDKARHDLCEALLKINVEPQIVCKQIYLPWFKICESNLTGFIESVSKTIVHFPEYACKSFLVELLQDGDSILVKHVEWITEIMKSLDGHCWCTLLSEYMKICDGLQDQRQIPVLLHLVKNCQKDLNGSVAEHLVALCKNAAAKHLANRDFVTFLVAVVGTVDLDRFRPEMMAIGGQLKGASKFLMAKALKDTK